MNISEREYMESLLRSLRKPQDCRRLMQCLYALRKQVNGPNYQARIGMIDFLALKALVGCTQHEGDKIVDLALSVLGNCCTNQVIARQTVHDLNIFHTLKRLLEKHRKDSIRGRIFRVFGNLCDASDIKNIIEKESELIICLLKFLDSFATEENKEDNEDEKPTVLTVSMALRVLRKLLRPRVFENLSNDFTTVDTIGSVLIKCSDDWVKDRTDDILLNDIIKIIQTLAYSIPSNYHDAVLIKLKRPFQTLADIILFHPEKITKIILKFRVSMKHVSDLPVEQILCTLLDTINPKTPTQLLNRECLECTFRLMSHQEFHFLLDSSKVVKLLDAFGGDDDGSINCCILLFSILNKCQDAKTSFLSEIIDKIIEIIKEKLQKFVGKRSDKIYVRPHKAKQGSGRDIKRLKSCEERSPLELETIAFLNCSPKRNWVHPDPLERCASPSSCSDASTTGPFSPGSSGINLDAGDSDSDDNYSPVCSENEDDDSDLKIPPDDDIVLSESEEKRPTYDKGQIELRLRLVDEMIVLLKRCCATQLPHFQLKDHKILTLLLNIILDRPSTVSGVTARNKLAFAVVSAIIKCPKSMIPIMQTTLVQDIHDLTIIKHDNGCEECNALQSIAEDLMEKFIAAGLTESLKGDIAYILLRKDDISLKEKITLSIPYVIRNSVVISKLMIDCGGLNILVRLLKNGVKLERGIRSLCLLATTSLKILNLVHSKYPKKRNVKNESPIYIGSYNLKMECNNTVIFKLDDGSLIEADRDLLCSASEYFNTLLTGNFIESKLQEITLKNATKNGLKCILKLIETNNITSKTTLQFHYNLDAVLEAIVLSNRFLLTDINEALVQHAVQLLDQNKVVDWYLWSISSGTDIMRVQIVAYALVGEITHRQKIAILNSLYDLGHVDILVDDVERLMREFM